MNSGLCRPCEYMCAECGGQQVPHGAETSLRFEKYWPPCCGGVGWNQDKDLPRLSIFKGDKFSVVIR